MIFKDYYKILNIDTSHATIEEIKVAYREEAKKYHPDVNIGNKNAEERFKDINEAYKVLSDPSSKRKYDRMWNSHIGKKKVSYEESKRDKDSIFSDFFHMFFGGNELEVEKKEKTSKNKKVAIKGENIDTEIAISIQEAFYGLEKKISLRAMNGKMKVFTIKIPAGIRNRRKDTINGTRKTRRKWWKKWRFIYQNQY